ncbi:MAG: hypothetical protein NWE87_00035 [Candidatus Bathyarchaeota archaeon]|nr:hypothetical protein [Candidatus Bathyarchaeota archaeon]
MSTRERTSGQAKLVFASIVFPDRLSETNALLLAESIRAFAGLLSHAPVWFYVPQNGKELSTIATNKLSALNVTLIPFDVDEEVLRFPFTGHSIAAALAESMASDQASFIVWLSPNTIMLQEPRNFLLQDNKALGFKPVHHTLLGSRYDEPLDSFWTLIYRYCDVPENRVVPMMTHVEGEKIRPYVNSGLLVTRPEKRLLRAWRDAFLKAYQEPAFREFYQQDERYAIFIHQAILSGVILSMLATEEMQELPQTYNYPLHLHTEDITGNRPSGLEELVTVRHEGFYKDPDWSKKMPAGEPIKQWIAERLLE